MKQRLARKEENIEPLLSISKILEQAKAAKLKSVK